MHTLTTTTARYFVDIQVIDKENSEESRLALRVLLRTHLVKPALSHPKSRDFWSVSVPPFFSTGTKHLWKRYVKVDWERATDLCP